MLGDWAGNKKDPDSRTDVLDDLKQAENFDEENYPLAAADYSLDVIQIAESVDDEVFVYVYHPGGVENTTAKTINISRVADDDVNLFVQVYNLELLSHTETLAKYCVKNLKVLDEETRYYKIVSVSREWIDDVDGEQSDDKVLKSIKIAKQYTVTGEGDKLNYSVTETSVVVIDNVVSGFIRYSEGNTYNVGSAVFESCDSWFVAFDTDMKIDDLIAARVYYISRTCEETNTTFVGTSYKYGEKTADDVYLTKYDSVSTTPNGDYKDNKYSWFRIQSVEAFLAENKDSLSDTLKSKLRGRQWILRYLETDYKNSQYSAGSTYTVCKEYTVVDEVTVIELKFESDGEIYNLGAVCDTISSPEEPDTVIRKDPNEDVDDFFSGIREWFESLGEGIATFFSILFWVIVAFLAYFVLKLIFSLISKIVDIFKKK